MKGFEELAKLYTELANLSVEQTSLAVKTLAAAKTPAEFQAAYSGFAKQNFETFVAEAKKVQELTAGVFSETIAPLNARAQSLTTMFKAA